MEKNTYIYVGTYDHRAEEVCNENQTIEHGIHILKLDREKRCITYEKTITNVDNPSFLLTDVDNKYLYSANETDIYEGQVGGSISAFKINQKSGDLDAINRVPSFGAHPCHLSLSPNGEYLIATNYSGGSFICYEVGPEGIGNRKVLVQHEGRSINNERQEEAHPHSSQFLNNREAFLVLDLGIDQLVAYDMKDGSIHKNNQDTIICKPGSGPRHSVLHPKQNIIYVAHELSSEITVLTYNEDTQGFHEVQRISTRNKECDNTAADIHITQDGKFLFVSNRGEDSLVCFSIDKVDGKLSVQYSIPCGGRTPRNFMIDPLEEFILVANQDTNQIVLFELNQATGKLIRLQELDIPKPVCVVSIIL